MKSLRGYIAPGTDPQRIIVDDGRFTHGFMVKEFYIWSPTFDSQVFGVLSYSPDYLKVLIMAHLDGTL